MAPEAGRRGGRRAARIIRLRQYDLQFVLHNHHIKPTHMPKNQTKGTLPKGKKSEHRKLVYYQCEYFPLFPSNREQWTLDGKKTAKQREQNALTCRRCTRAKSALRARACDARSSKPFTPFIRIASICCKRCPNRLQYAPKHFPQNFKFH